ncbi:MAG: molecular chaperone Hsp33 [bacterium]|jgi:molecular chaperone Hsp33
MLPESQIYSLLDKSNEFNIQFLEGQKLIHDLALTHEIKGNGFAYFRELVLTLQLLNSQLKAGEQFGFYLDSESPYFRLKLEMNSGGLMRSLLYPENFNEFPEILDGVVRLVKTLPKAQPYTSLISIEGLGHHQIVDKILHDSYQIDAAILVSETSDQSIMVTKLPPSKFKPVEEQTKLTAKDFLEDMKINFLQLFDQHHTDTYDLKMGFEGLGFQFLGGRQAKFQCNCSKERVVQSILSLGNISLEDLFKGDEKLDTHCDYCKKDYEVTKQDIQDAQKEA